MSPRRRRRARKAAAPAPAPRSLAHPLGVLLLLALVPALFVGWKAFWFLTDDAHIAFRYVAQSRAGHGWVWNAPPFRPVEGYTSFLWVAVLDVVWRVTGIAPPQSANPLLLLCGYGTLAAGLAMGLRAPLPAHLAPHRLALLGLALGAVVANRTFLAWTSSGLETSLFDLLFTLWIAFALALRPGHDGDLRRTSAAAALLALTRPDGVLAVLATLGLGVLPMVRARRFEARRLAPLAPLLAVVAHLAWRRWFYGAWVPNTYAAKVSGAWPAAGLRWALCFVLEYALWVPLALGVAVAWRARKRALATLRDALTTSPGSIAAAVTVTAHLAYYVLVIGGDHFEYRVLAYTLVPLAAALPWMLGRLGARPATAYGVVLSAFALSLPIPWTHWTATRGLRTRAEASVMLVPLAPRFPALARPYVQAWDDLQAWMIPHLVGTRHQEHAVFYETLLAQRTEHPAPARLAAPHAVWVTTIPGTMSWDRSDLDVLDPGGLNDRVIARSPRRDVVIHKMAHDRAAPPGYVDCFRPNVDWTPAPFREDARPSPLTDADVRACEARAWPAEATPPETPLPAAPAGWTVTARDAFGHADLDGFTRAVDLFVRLPWDNAAAAVRRQPSRGVLLPRGTPVQVLEHHWLAGRARVRAQGRDEPLWVLSELLR